MAGCNSALHMDFWLYIVNDRCFCKMKCCFKPASIALIAHKQPWFHVTAGFNLVTVSLPVHAQRGSFAAMLCIVVLCNCLIKKSDCSWCMAFTCTLVCYGVMRFISSLLHCLKSSAALLDGSLTEAEL